MPEMTVDLLMEVIHKLSEDMPVLLVDSETLAVVHPRLFLAEDFPNGPALVIEEDDDEEDSGFAGIYVKRDKEGNLRWEREEE